MNAPEHVAPPAWIESAALDAARRAFTDIQMVPPERTAQIVSRIQIAMTEAMQFAIAHQDAESSARALQVSMERSRAVEWGGYLVTAANNLIDGVNALAELDMKIDDGEEVDGDEHAHAREVLGERMQAVRARVYDFERKVAEGTRNIDRHAQPAKLDDETVNTIRAFMDRPGEHYRNGVASLGIGFGRALAERITEVNAKLDALPPQQQEVFNLRAALAHIERTAQRSREKTRRTRWIELRARGALDGTDEWRTIDLPKNGEPSKVRMKHALAELQAENERLRSATMQARIVRYEHRDTGPLETGENHA